MGEMRAGGAKIKDQSGIFVLLVLYLRYFCDHLRFCTLFMPFLSLFTLCMRPNFALFVLYFFLFVRFLLAFCSFFSCFFEKADVFLHLTPPEHRAGHWLSTAPFVPIFLRFSL
ncbi:MAG: hypothetical protein IJW11_04025 [Clostridia bacterium]|nr:hypothetical protein [Clostridia bacterium]